MCNVTSGNVQTDMYSNSKSKRKIHYFLFATTYTDLNNLKMEI